jgi:membrane fusion protein, heavy metal efflux system
LIFFHRNVLGVGIGIAVGVAGIVAARSFERATVDVETPSDGSRVGDHAITLPADAAAWKVVHRGVAAPLTERWSDPYPARFKVDEARAARVGSPLAGRVSQVFVEIGQSVKAGDPLVMISSPDVAELRSERQKADVDLKVAKAKEERIQAMVDARAVPGSDALNAEHDLKEAELELALSDTKLSSLRVSASGHNAFTILAPRDGVVIEKNVLPGQQVTTEGTLFGVADLDTIWVVADLFETDAATAVSKGNRAHITSPSLPGVEIDAEVEQVSSVANPEGHTVSVRIAITNAQRSIRPNAYAEVRFREPAPPGAVEVGASAVVSDGDKQYVYVEQGSGHFVRREVVAGAARQDRVEVLRGLAAGDVVVEEGSALIDNQIALST